MKLLNERKLVRPPRGNGNHRQERRDGAEELHADLPGYRDPAFLLFYPEGWSTRKLRAQIQDAVVQATKEKLPASKLCEYGHREEYRRQYR